ncbi:MAG: L-aspartate oxidase [Caldilineaceae bacterium]|nr:L-aspartate oxidase [Caldilineaceae bacterium]
MTTDLLETDVLILGCGIAGGTTALTLADAGVAVTVVTRGKAPETTNTYWAQGGIIYTSHDDSPDLLVEDILRAGAGHCYEPAVRLLAQEGPAAVRRVLLERLNVPFDHTTTGALSLTLEGGHTLPRIVHAADATGKAIEIALLNALAAHPNVTLLTGHTAVDLLTPSHHSRNRLRSYEPRTCVGAYLFDQEEGQAVRCLAKQTVLATGGLGQVFLRTTNPVGARGDGLAMAYRAGVRIINAEFVQFHPTAFYYQNGARFLVSEAVRGAGARLIDAKGKPFMAKYAPEWKDLAPRDVVAQSIHREMLEQDLTNVYLDLASYLAPDQIRAKFPTIYARSLEYGVDITEDPVPVVPASHYSCGGIWVDEWGRTDRQHLYAVGEVSCTGVHGANRLASTSLLEGLVWGERAAQHILATLPVVAAFDAAEIPAWVEPGNETADPALISQDMSSIKHIMWNYVGLVRTAPRLERALRELNRLETEIEQFYRQTRLSDELIGLRNAVRTALLITNAAWQNKRSIGCHYRE